MATRSSFSSRLTGREFAAGVLTLFGTAPVWRIEMATREKMKRDRLMPRSKRIVVTMVDTDETRIDSGDLWSSQSA